MLGRSPASPRSTPISRLPLTPLGPIVVPAGRRSYPPVHSASGRSHSTIRRSANVIDALVHRLNRWLTIRRRRFPPHETP